jgi:hypothetical protein
MTPLFANFYHDSERNPEAKKVEAGGRDEDVGNFWIFDLIEENSYDAV